MEDVIANKSFFNGKTVSIEYNVSGKRIDLRTNLDEWIEYKWLESGALDRSTFLAEFVGRDLKFKPQIQGLQWKIKGYKLSKADVIGHLSSPEGRAALEELGEARAKLLFPQDLAIDETNFVDRIIANIDSKYNTIFP